MVVAVEPLQLGGQPYEVDPPEAAVALEASRSPSGWLLRARTRVVVQGPCWRCLAAARLAAEVDAREFQSSGRSGSDPFDEGLDSPYLTAEVLDVEAWVRDAVCDELPSVILCDEACLGLCPTCGANLNPGPCSCARRDAPDRPPVEPGPFAGLSERIEAARREFDGGT